MTLRDATAADLPWLRGLVAGDAAAPFLSTDAAADLEALPGGDRERLLVIEDDGAPAGAVRVVVVNRRSRIADIRTLVLDPAARGRGLAVATLRALADRYLRDEGLHRLEAEVYGFNQPALRAFTAAGFTREGVRRRAYDRHGAWQDGVRFGLLADDPPVSAGAP
ncbi:MAG: GNAT family N-acetyltransferase [Solirubrobacterales bacterium]|nr:GNAT family N-acetyltransferase [Solirubrobacterales bacterium]